MQVEAVEVYAEASARLKRAAAHMALAAERRGEAASVAQAAKQDLQALRVASKAAQPTSSLQRASPIAQSMTGKLATMQASATPLGNGLYQAYPKFLDALVSLVQQLALGVQRASKERTRGDFSCLVCQDGRQVNVIDPDDKMGGVLATPANTLEPHVATVP